MPEFSPGEVEAVGGWLTSNGFRLTAARDGPGFGDRVEEWQQGDVLFRLVRDRGQWFVEVGRTGWEDYFDVDLVSEVCDFEESTALGRVTAAAKSDLDRLLPVLQSARTRQARDRLR